jgi:hypothetical protein
MAVSVRPSKLGPASAVGLGRQVAQFLVAEVRRVHPVQQPGQPGVHTVASLVHPVVGVFAKEVIELRWYFV